MTEIPNALTVNAAMYETTLQASDPDPRTRELARLLHGLVDFDWVRHGKRKMPMTVRKAICKKIDDLHREGAPWPIWPRGESYGRMSGSPVHVRPHCKRQVTRCPRIA
jgi:hypothetical protein